MPHRSPKLVNEPNEPRMASFRALAGCVFQGNVNDNAMRMLIWWHLGHVVAGNYSGHSPDFFRTMVGVFFALPWVLLSLFAGQVADKFSKREVAVLTKGAEVVLYGAGSVVVYVAGPEGWGVALLLLALVAARTCLFGPATYGMLPELMPERRLSWANGVIDGLTFLGGVVGTAFGAWAAGFFGERIYIPLAALACFSLVGLVVTRGIEPLAAASPGRPLRFFPLGQIRANLSVIRRLRGVGWSIGGVVCWWALAALALATAMKIAEDRIGLGAMGSFRFYSYVVFGVALGHAAAGYLSAGKIELGLVPFGGVGMTVSALAVWMLPVDETALAIGIACLGFFSGFFIIPLKAFIQHQTPIQIRGGVLGMVNFFTYVGMVASAAGLYYALTEVLGLNGQQMFLCLGVAAAAMTVASVRAMPVLALRFVLYVITHTVYRMRVDGRENIPTHGGALLVCNHLSYADGMFVVASLDRPVRILMFEDIYNRPWVRPFARLSGAIPVSDRMGPRALLESLDKAGETIKRGHLVCIFAEGQITRTGQLLPFRRGLERVMKGVEAPVIPMHLDRVWGSVFSFKHRKFIFKVPERIPWPITVTYGRRLPASARAATVRHKVQELASEAWEHRKAEANLLHQPLFRTALRKPFVRRISDPACRRPITALGYAVRVLAWSEVVGRTFRGQRVVPFRCGGSVELSAMAHGALLAGKTLLPLPDGLEGDRLERILRRVKARRFVVDRPGGVAGEVDFAQLHPGAGAFRWVWLAVVATVLPMRVIERSFQPPRRGPDDPAAILLRPNGNGGHRAVRLTHWNLAAAITACGEVFNLERGDRIAGVLPASHAYGLVTNLLLPTYLGTGIHYCGRGGAREQAEQIEGRGLTVLLAEPGLLAELIRRVEPRQLGSVQMVLVGGEGVEPGMIDEFAGRFRVDVFEGYGFTETSGIVAVNTPDYRAAGFLQQGGKPGRIGHPVPGVSVRAVDPDTGAELPDGEPGVFLVRGPNVAAQAAAEVDAEGRGWFRTGDLGLVDEDGFLKRAAGEWE